MTRSLITQKHALSSIALFMALCWAMPTQATSFDCKRASTQVEQLICATPELSQADDHLKKSYDQLLKLVPSQRSLKQQQRSWLANVLNHCLNSACLAREYNARIEILEADTQSLLTSNNANVCGTIVGFINRGTLSVLSVPSIEPTPNPEVIQSIFGESPYYTERYWLVDLNGDGIADHIEMTEEGTAHLNGAYAVSGRKGAEVSELSDDPPGPIEVLTLGRQHYVYSTNLWTLDKEGKFQKICSIEPSGEPELQLDEGKDKQVCSDLKNALSLDHHMFILPADPHGEFKRLIFNQPHKLKHPAAPEHTYLEGLAQADINNDGHLHNIVRIESTYVGGLPCSDTTIAVTDSTGTSVPDTETNRILTRQLGGYRCSSSLEALIYRGTTYIHLLDTGNAVYRITRGKAEKVCSFHTTQKYEATPVE